MVTRVGVHQHEASEGILTMAEKSIFCEKLKREGIALAFPPFPGEIGQRIQQYICQEAWQQWLAHQTMLINENRLNMLDPKARAYLQQEMEKFLFGEGSEKPVGYTPLEETQNDSLI